MAADRARGRQASCSASKARLAFVLARIEGCGARPAVFKETQRSGDEEILRPAGERSLKEPRHGDEVKRQIDGLRVGGTFHAPLHR